MLILRLHNSVFSIRNYQETQVSSPKLGTQRTHYSKAAYYARTSWPKMGVLGQNGVKGGAIFTPNELCFSFWGSYVCANFGENRSRNATVRVPTDGHNN